MQTEVQRRLEETVAGVFWLLAQQKEALNDAYADISDVTEWAETSETESLTTSNNYDLSSISANTILTVHGVFNTQTNRWLTPASVREWDRRNGLWEDETGEPDEFGIAGLWWLRVKPRKASAAGTMVIHYTYVPAALSADGDTPAFPAEFHPGLVAYACYDLLCQERETDKALKFYAEYLGHREGLKRYVQNRASYDRVSRI
jgi:hypothetical protein